MNSWCSFGHKLIQVLIPFVYLFIVTLTVQNLSSCKLPLHKWLVFMSFNWSFKFLDYRAKYSSTCFFLNVYLISTFWHLAYGPEISLFKECVILAVNNKNIAETAISFESLRVAEILFQLSYSSILHSIFIQKFKYQLSMLVMNVIQTLSKWTNMRLLLK